MLQLQFCDLNSSGGGSFSHTCCTTGSSLDPLPVMCNCSCVNNISSVFTILFPFNFHKINNCFQLTLHPVSLLYLQRGKCLCVLLSLLPMTGQTRRTQKAKVSFIQTLGASQRTLEQTRGWPIPSCSSVKHWLCSFAHLLRIELFKQIITLASSLVYFWVTFHLSRCSSQKKVPTHSLNSYVHQTGWITARGRVTKGAGVH